MDFKKITEEYKYKTELHAHSLPVSGCGKFTATEVIEIYASEGCDTLTLTNHITPNYLVNRTPEKLYNFYLKDYYDAKEAAQKYGMNVALGFEVRFGDSNNDYLVYGVTPEDLPYVIELLSTDISTFYKEFKNDKNVILHAHPFRPSTDPTPLGSVDGIETFNTHPGHNAAIGLATKFAKKHDLIVSGGSDFHEAGRQATCFMRTKKPMLDSYDIAEALKSRDVIFDLTGHIVIPYL